MRRAGAQQRAVKSGGIVAALGHLAGAAMMDAADAKALNLPDRPDQHEKFMETRVEAMKTLNEALKPLYDAFSDAQREAADQLIWGPMGMM